MSRTLDKLYEWYLDEECGKDDPKEIKQAINEYESTLERILEEKSKNGIGAVGEGMQLW